MVFPGYAQKGTESLTLTKKGFSFSGPLRLPGAGVFPLAEPDASAPKPEYIDTLQTPNGAFLRIENVNLNESAVDAIHGEYRYPVAGKPGSTKPVEFFILYAAKKALTEIDSRVAPPEWGELPQTKGWPAYLLTPGFGGYATPLSTATLTLTEQNGDLSMAIRRRGTDAKAWVPVSIKDRNAQPLDTHTPKSKQVRILRSESNHRAILIGSVKAGRVETWFVAVAPDSMPTVRTASAGR
ncbi:MAG: hypothetical protein V1798_02135 [Pseudomonadota bacterium]